MDRDPVTSQGKLPARHEAPSFERAVDDYGPALWRIAGIYAVDRDSREDLYQEILVALWKAMPTFRGEASLRTFVYRVGHNRGATFFARRRRRERREQRFQPGDETEPKVPAVLPAAGHAAENAELGVRLRRAVATLPEPLAQVTSLRLEGLTAGEIGAVLGLSTNNVEVRLHRARAKLRAALDPEDFR